MKYVKKIMDWLYKMKRIELNYSWERALCSCKRVPFCFKKGLLDNPEQQMEVESSLIGCLFSHLQLKLRKKFLFRKGTFQRSVRYLDAFISEIRLDTLLNHHKVKDFIHENYFLKINIIIE